MGGTPNMFRLAAILPFHKIFDFQGGQKDSLMESFSGHRVTIEEDSHNLQRLTQKSKRARKKRRCNREGQWEKDKSLHVQHLPHQRQAIACQSAIFKLWAWSNETPNLERERKRERRPARNRRRAHWGNKAVTTNPSSTWESVFPHLVKDVAITQFQFPAQYGISRLNKGQIST